MSFPTIRRNSSPLSLQHLWKCIEFIRKQKQIANIERITRYMEREYGYSHKDVLIALHKSIRDQMIVETISLGVKGSMAGVEQEGYWIPSAETIKYRLDSQTIDSSHDWYCFACHNGGKVISCASCFRVFHLSCIKSNENAPVNNWKCKYCTTPESNIVNKHDLNEAFSCMLSHFSMNSLLMSEPDEIDFPYYNAFVYEHMDMTIVMEKCKEKLFKSCDEITAALKLIEHNCHIMYGPHHEATQHIEEILQQCEQEIYELLLCQNCFLLSNTKSSKDWFTNPCDPPHKVVWAKQKGFDYWPAKLLRVGLEDGKADCRFFGSHHERAWVPLTSIKCISHSPAKLGVKKSSSGWVRAFTEMKEYIRKCEYHLGLPMAEMVVNFKPELLVGIKDLNELHVNIKGIVWVMKKIACPGSGREITLWPAKLVEVRRKKDIYVIKFFGSNEKIMLPGSELKYRELDVFKKYALENNPEWLAAIKEGKTYLNEVKLIEEIPLGNKTNNLLERRLKRKQETAMLEEYGSPEKRGRVDDIAMTLYPLVGEKTKLLEESARTWKYSTEVTTAGYFRLLSFQWFCANIYNNTNLLPKEKERTPTEMSHDIKAEEIRYKQLKMLRLNRVKQLIRQHKLKIKHDDM